ncbi:MAG: GtrA family protein [Acidimicrobiia bacterium]|nr:GtrA family protein [Acidimicrobiia bacterium]
MPPALSEFVRTQFDHRHVRFTMVSVVAVSTNQAFLFLFQALGMSPSWANFLSVTIGCGPSYIGNRYWVWGKRGKNHFWREVFPFWVMALIGLVFSTVLIAIVSNWTTAPLAINATNLVAFGSLWVIKYLVLDKVLFKVAEHELAAAA